MGAGGHIVINLVGCAVTDIALYGHLSSDGKTLLLSDVAAPVSTVTTIDPMTGNVLGVWTRVCSQTGTAVRVR